MGASNRQVDHDRGGAIMKFWKSRKAGENKNDDRQSNAPPEANNPAPSDYECLWILVCRTFSQVLPGIDLSLCLNERGELAYLALPDLLVSMTMGKASMHPRPGIVLVQQIRQGEDRSYLSPIIFTEQQLSFLSGASSAYDKSELWHWLKKHNTRIVISEVKTQNITLLNDAANHQRVSRIRIIENASPRDSDDVQELPGYEGNVPVFLYAEPSTQIEMGR